MRVGITGTISLLLLAQSTVAQQLPKEEPSPDSAFAKATIAVNAKLKDPQSARYGDMVRKLAVTGDGKHTEVVCGTVNDTDSVGRDGGNRPFVYFIADGHAYLVDANPKPEDVAQILYRRFCK
jgi:hypothetical protein